MSTNWIKPVRTDLLNVISSEVMEKADENVGPDTQSTDGTIDPDLPTRSGNLLAQVVTMFRGAIRQGQYMPLSVTPDCVPPETLIHVWTIAAWRLVNAKANLPMVIITEQGAYAPMAQAYKEAMTYLANIAKGMPTPGMTPPTDPTGRDYLTAVTDDNLAIKNAVRYGSANCPQDLTLPAFSNFDEATLDAIGYP